jgi:hypothetical protein
MCIVEYKEMLAEKDYPVSNKREFSGHLSFLKRKVLNATLPGPVSPHPSPSTIVAPLVSA